MWDCVQSKHHEWRSVGKVRMKGGGRAEMKDECELIYAHELE